MAGSIATLEILKEIIYLTGVLLRFRTTVVNGDTGHESADVFADRPIEDSPSSEKVRERVMACIGAIVKCWKMISIGPVKMNDEESL